MAKLCAIAGALAGCAAAAGAPAKAAFEEFVAKYHRSYETEEERERRFEIFAANLARIEANNGRGSGVKFGINEFADLTPQEFSSAYIGGARRFGIKEAKGSGMYLGRHVPTTAELPDSVDWVEKGAVNTPMAQLKCGSCWTFSTTGALEGAWKIATGELKKFSEQQLVDCAHTGILSGCHGGDQSQAFQWLEGHHLCTEQSYPYTHVEGQCAESQCEVGIPKGGVTGFKSVDVDDTEALRSAAAQQPVAVSIDANETVFQLYDGGIIKHDCGSKLDHAVLLVGYGTEDGVDYWKVKNSWGPDWGEGGYVRIVRGLPEDGECGIKAEPVYPVVSTDSEATLVV